MRKQGGPWLRLYSRVVNDRKVQSLPGELFKRWISILCIASENGGALPSVDDIAFKLRCSPKEAQSSISHLIEKKLLDETEKGITPHDWAEWQYESDFSRDRMRRHRDGKSPSQSPSLDRHEAVTVTPRARDRTEQTRTEQNAAAFPSSEDAASDTTRRIYERHPKHRRGALRLVMDEVVTLLTDAVNPDGLIAKLDRSHESACRSKGWTKDGGEFVPGLAKWIRSRDWDTDEAPVEEKSQYRPVSEVLAQIRGEQ